MVAEMPLEYVDTGTAASFNQITFQLAFRGSCAVICLHLLIRQDEMKCVLYLPSSIPFSHLGCNSLL